MALYTGFPKGIGGHAFGSTPESRSILINEGDFMSRDDEYDDDD